MVLPEVPKLIPTARVLYAGMGGSALPADLINGILPGPDRMELLRGYTLPSWIKKHDLLLAASFSGNTEETLQVVEQGLERGCSIITLSHGGKLESLAQKKNLPHVFIPPCVQPRCATGYFFASLLGLFHRMERISSYEKPLEDLRGFLLERQVHLESLGKTLAESLHHRIPIVYSPTEFEAVARIWKIKFNENSKIPAFYNVFPELNHNEMVGFTNLLMPVALIYLQPRVMHPRIAKRMQVMAEILKKDIPILEVKLSGKTHLEEIFEASMIGDYASYFLALRYGIDPAPVHMVEDFKKRLGS